MTFKFKLGKCGNANLLWFSIATRMKTNCCTPAINIAALASKSRVSGFCSVSSIIMLQQWTGGRPPQQWRIQNYVCHVPAFKKKMPIWNWWPYLALAGSCRRELALSSRSSPLALQFLVQQRHFLSSIEQVLVVQRSDSSCTAHLRSDPLKRTTKLALVAHHNLVTLLWVHLGQPEALQ